MLGEIVHLKSEEEMEQMRQYMLKYSQTLESMVIFDNKPFYIQKEDHD